MDAVALVIRLWKVAWGEPYNVAMWGWTFPAAALAGTFERAATVLASPLYSVLAAAALLLATVSVVACASATLMGWMRSLVAPSAGRAPVTFDGQTVALHNLSTKRSLPQPLVLTTLLCRGASIAAAFRTSIN